MGAPGLPPPTPIRPDIVAATVVELSTRWKIFHARQGWGILGGVNRRWIRIDRVFLHDGRCLSDLAAGSAVAFVPAVYTLLVKVSPVPGTRNWEAAAQRADAGVQAETGQERACGVSDEACAPSGATAGERRMCAPADGAGDHHAGDRALRPRGRYRGAGAGAGCRGGADVGGLGGRNSLAVGFSS